MKTQVKSDTATFSTASTQGAQGIDWHRLLILLMTSSTIGCDVPA